MPRRERSERDGPRDRVNPIRVFVNTWERERIRDRAKMAGMTVSAFVRAAALGAPIRSVLDLDAVRELAAVNASQQDLIAMLRHLGPGDPHIQTLIRRIDCAQDILSKAAQKVRT